MTAIDDASRTQQGFIAPVRDADSEPWWLALAEHRLVLPRCGGCDRHWFPPTPGCPHCGHVGHVMVEASGRGRIYTWVVVNRAMHRAFAADAPYVIGLVELEEGPRLFARIVGDRRRIRADAAVTADFYEVEGTTLLGFRLDDA